MEAIYDSEVTGNLLSSTMSLSMLSLYFARVNSWIVSHIDIICGNLSGDFAVAQEVGLFFHTTVPEQWNVQLQATGHCCNFAVISSSGAFQCPGEESLFERGLTFWGLCTSFNIRSKNWNIAQKSDITWCCHKLHHCALGLALHWSPGKTVMLSRPVLRNWTVL